MLYIKNSQNTPQWFYGINVAMYASFILVKHLSSFAG